MFFQNGEFFEAPSIFLPEKGNGAEPSRQFAKLGNFTTIMVVACDPWVCGQMSAHTHTRVCNNVPKS